LDTAIATRGAHKTEEKQTGKFKAALLGVERQKRSRRVLEDGVSKGVVARNVSLIRDEIYCGVRQ
jgi:hypothetical protein